MVKVFNKKVSIVVPVYNAEKYLKECVDSLIKQDYDNTEIILVDDGSTDNSPQICDEYRKKDERVKVIHKKNAGVSAARNDGIKKSTGEWVTFVDADDWVEKDYVRYHLKNGVSNNSEICLSTFPNKVNKDNKVNNWNRSEDSIKTISGVEAAKMMMYYKIVISSWNKMFKMSFIKNNNILFKENLSYGEGFDFVINSMLKANKVTIGRGKVYNYRVDNENSAMTVFKEKLVTGSIDSQNNIKKRIYDSYSNDSKILDELLKAWKYSNWHTHCDCLNTIYGSDNSKKNQNLTKKVSKVCRKTAISAFNNNVPTKDRLKGVLYLVSPYVASIIINKMRMRKFTKN